MSEVLGDLSGRIDRRTLIKVGVVGAAALTAGAIAAAPAQAAGGSNKFTLRVLADTGALSIAVWDVGPITGEPGPFYIPGTIFEPGAGGAELGSFHCWGFFFEPEGAIGVVSQEYNLDGRGKIQVQGVEDEGPRAVTGGTGDFRNTRGEMTGADLSAFPDFTVTFNLIG